MIHSNSDPIAAQPGIVFKATVENGATQFLRDYREVYASWRCSAWSYCDAAVGVYPRILDLARNYRLRCSVRFVCRANLAIFSQSRLRLQLKADGGNSDAARVLEPRRNSSQVLMTVICGNVATNVLLSRPDIVHTSVYLPVHEALREAAFKERGKIHDIIMEGTGLALRKRRYPAMGN